MLGSGLFNTYNPASVWADDSAIFFDGVNDYVYIDCHILVNIAGKNTTTLSLWFKADEPPEANFFIWQHKETSGSNDANQYLWYDEGNEQVKFTRTDTDGNSATTSIYNWNKVRVQTWAHVIVTIDKDDAMIILINNTADASGTTATSPGAWTSGTTKIYYGSNAGANSFFNGYVSNVAIWTKLLTLTERTAIYNNGYAKNELNTSLSDLFLYHVSNERNHSGDTGYQIVTYALANSRRANYSGAIITSRPD